MQVPIPCARGQPVFLVAEAMPHGDKGFILRKSQLLSLLRAHIQVPYSWLKLPVEKPSHQHWLTSAGSSAVASVASLGLFHRCASPWAESFSYLFSISLLFLAQPHHHGFKTDFGRYQFGRSLREFTSIFRGKG